MRLATWNVNSVQARLPRLLGWLEETRPDVLCLQETKVADAAFPGREVADARLRGRRRRRRPLERRRHPVPGRAGGRAPRLSRRAGVPRPGGPRRLRHLRGLRVWSVYVPNGREPGQPPLAYKLSWLAALRDVLAAARPDGGGRRSPSAATSTSPRPTTTSGTRPHSSARPTSPPKTGGPGRTAGPRAHRRAGPGAQGPSPSPTGTTGPGMFHKGMGMRIDLVLASGVLAAAVRTPTSTGRPARARGRPTTPRSLWTWICPRPPSGAWPRPDDLAR